MTAVSRQICEKSGSVRSRLRRGSMWIKVGLTAPYMSPLTRLGNLNTFTAVVNKCNTVSEQLLFDACKNMILLE